MDSIVLEDSPLAQYLEAEGTRDPQQTSDFEAEVGSNNSLPAQQSFAPRGTAAIRARLKDKLPAKLQLQKPNTTVVGSLHDAWLRAINSRMGRADNTRFLEHFRYIIVASQLLTENPGPSALRPNVPRLDSPLGRLSNLEQSQAIPINIVGAATTALTAYALVWLVNWARPSQTAGPNRLRIFVVLSALLLLIIGIYIYARRQWLRCLRQEAVESVSALVAHIQGLDASTSSALLLIQEVELVARGYRISSPMPPVTRLEEKTQTTQTRRCQRLRKALRTSFVAIVPQFAESYKALRNLADEHDFEKYLDVYEIGNQDLQEAVLGVDDLDPEELENLKMLKLHHYRLNILQRITLCALLALRADGQVPDFSRWRAAVDIMNSLLVASASAIKDLVDILDQEEQFNVPQTPIKTHPPSPGRERLRNQVRKLTSLSQGIRGLQAKMQLLREESNKTLEASDDVTELGSTLMQQYESIGADLKSLQQAWEEGKKSLALNIDKHERRVSLASSSGLRSPVPSLGGLTAVDESSGGGSPGDALRALNGDLPGLSSATSLTSESDEEVFEAIALPKQRSVLSREERIAKMQDERERRASLMEKRNAETSMLRELESVISLRQPRKAVTTARVTSKGVSVRAADFDDPPSMIKAFTGCDKLLLISTPRIQLDFHDAPHGKGREKHHFAAIEAARQAGVSHIYYTSLAFGSNSKAGVMVAHNRTEDHLQNSSGIGFTIIREGLYNESWPLYFGHYKVPDDDRTEVPVAADGPISWTPIEDMGLGTALVVADDPKKYNGKMFYLSSNASYKIQDVAKTVTEAKGRPVDVKIVGKEGHVKYYVNEKGMDEGLVKWWASTYDAVLDGECDIKDDTLEKLIAARGKKNETVEEKIRMMLL
ncbi:MAG: hypothetical protein Q9165_006064 [Trypethelium subeluteriae]